jgi:hypothetical protein
MQLLSDRGFERVYAIGNWIIVIGSAYRTGIYHHSYGSYWIADRAPLAIGPGGQRREDQSCRP